MTPASVLSPLLTDAEACYPRRDRHSPGLHQRVARATTPSSGSLSVKELPWGCHALAEGDGLALPASSSAGSEPTILGPP
jgi:hypothetical protein